MTNENESSSARSITMYVTDDSICRSNSTTRGKLSCHSLYPVYHIWKKNCFPFSRHGLFSSNQLPLLLVFSPPLSRSHFSRRIFFFSPSLLCGHPSSNVSPTFATSVVSWKFQTWGTSIAALHRSKFCDCLGRQQRARIVQFVQIRKFRYSWWSFGRKSDRVG